LARIRGPLKRIEGERSFFVFRQNWGVSKSPLKKKINGPVIFFTAEKEAVSQNQANYRPVNI